MTDTANWLDRYQPWRRSAEIGFWVVAFLVNAVFNSLTVLMDVQRARLDFAPWKPAVWETSSGLLILLLVPTVVWFTRRFPLHRDTWRRHLPWYLPASVVWSLAHVAGMSRCASWPMPARASTTTSATGRWNSATNTSRTCAASSPRLR